LWEIKGLQGGKEKSASRQIFWADARAKAPAADRPTMAATEKTT
jgi:hypothetical protein